MATKDKVIYGPESKSGNDEWVHTVCNMCYTNCGVIARKVNGTVARVQGDPNCPHNWGKLCAKGNAGFITLYDPYRVRTPLKRTNPEKGIGVEPGWQEISWEEALDMIVAKLKSVRADDPRRLFFATFDLGTSDHLIPAWISAFGSTNRFMTPASYYCGAALHMMTYLTNASFHSEIDLDYCNFCLLIGNQKGFMAGVNPNINTQKMADARSRGMKLVVIDPQCCNAAAKADEWIPIRPGTDGALALAMLNVLLNEEGIYDETFLRKHTNGPYLVKPDGYYMRDEATGKPLVWDISCQEAKSYDSPADDLALEGTYEIEGTPCQPAFQLLKEHVKKYTPEGVSPITTVPAETIRRLAMEFGQAAQIGSQIVIEGKTFPFRPAAVNQYRGAYSHKHGTHTALSIQLLNLVVGSMYVPGGYRGSNPVGPGWSFRSGRDGMLLSGEPSTYPKDPYEFYFAKPGVPQSGNLRELFPAAWAHSTCLQLAIMEPSKFRLTFKPDTMIHCRTNIMTNTADREAMAQALKNVSFQLSFAREIDETVEFADIVLPEGHYLERLDPFPNDTQHALSASGGYWYWGLRQPVVEPPAGVRHWCEVLIEIARQMGFLEDLNALMNITFDLKDPYKLDPGKMYRLEEIADARAKSMFGPERDLSWFKEHGYFNVKRKIEETYPYEFMKYRIPIYYEHFLDAGQFVQESARAVGLPWDLSDFQPLPNWRPCPAYEDDLGYDLYVVNATLPFHSYTLTPANPWLNDLSERHPYAYKVMINAAVAEKKGMREGDWIWVESPVGKVKGQAKVTECIHPEVVGIAGVFGNWAKGKPVGLGKGAHFNSLVPFSLDRIDVISSGLDACVRVKLYKADEG